MKTKITSLLFLLAVLTTFAREGNFTSLNDVTWNSPGTNENDSMPLGNGDIALNAWTESTGDIAAVRAAVPTVPCIVVDFPYRESVPIDPSTPVLSVELT